MGTTVFTQVPPASLEVRSRADNGDSLRLRPTLFLDKLVQIVQGAGQQQNRTFRFKRSGSNDGIDGAPMT